MVSPSGTTTTPEAQRAPVRGFLPWWIALALVALVFTAFAPALDAAFVDWDDPQNFLENTRWQGRSLDDLRWMWTTPHMGHYHPVTWLTFAFDAWTGRADPASLHATSVVLHALATLAFALLARRFFAAALPRWSNTRRDVACGLAAALFALHPLRCESVAWLTERRDVLQGLFLALALLAWCRYAQEGERKRDLACAWIAFVLAWLSKGTAIVLPALLVIVDVWPLRRWSAANARRLVLEKLPFLALMPFMAWMTLWAAKSAGSTLRTLEGHGLGTRIAQAAYATVFYPLKSLAPVALRPIYSLPEDFDPRALAFVAAIAGALAISAAASIFARRAPAFAVAWLAYLAVIAPVSGLLQAGPQLVAERYTYTAMQPFALLAAAGIVACARSRGSSWICGAVACAALGACVLATRAQAAHWRSSASLWEHTLAVAPEEPHALLHLGTLRYRAALEARATNERDARLDEALELYHRGQALSKLPHLRMNEGLALALRAESRPLERIELLTRARALADETFRLAAERGDDVDPVWHVHRASFLFKLGHPEEALPEMERFVALRPDDPQAHRTLAVVCAALKLDARREDSLARAAELDERDALSCVQLAQLRAARGDTAGANAATERARQRRARGAPLPPAEEQWLERATKR